MHFCELFGKVYECAFIRNFGSLLQLLMDLASKEEELEIVEQKGLLLAKELEKTPVVHKKGVDEDT
jgi:hypothetical protein